MPQSKQKKQPPVDPGDGGQRAHEGRPSPSMADAGLDGLTAQLSQMLAEQVTEGIAILDRAGHVLHANQIWAAIHGRRPEEIIGQPYAALHLPEELRRSIDESEWLTLPGRRTHCRADGSTFDILVRVTPLASHSGQEPVLFILSGTAVSPAYPGMLHADYHQLNAILNALPDLLFLIDGEGHIYDYRAPVDMSLYAPPEVFLGRQMGEILPPDLAGMLRGGVEAAREHGHYRGQSYSMELGGRTHWYEFSVTRIQGGEERYVVLVHEITERVEAEQAEREQRAMAEALRETAAALSSTLDLDELFDRILESLERVLPHDAANVMLIEDGVARIVRARGYEPLGLAETIRGVEFVVAETQNLRRMVETRQPSIIPNVIGYPNWDVSITQGKLRSYAGAPISFQGPVIGFLNLDSTEEGFFTPAHTERLRAFADQAAIAINNARMYRALEERVSQLHALHEVSLNITTRRDLSATLQAIVESATQLCRARASSLYLLGVEADRIVLVNIAGPAVVPIGRALRRGEGLIGTCWEQGETIMLDNYIGWEKRLRELDEHRITAAMAVPVRWGGDMVGVLSVTAGDPSRRFSQNDREILEMLALQAAIAITNARLHEEQVRHIDELTARNQELDAFSYTVAHDLKSPLQVIVGFANLLRTEYRDEVSDEIAEYLGHIEDYGLKLSQTVEGLLLLARLRNADAEVGPTDVGPVIESALERFSEQLQAQRITVTVEPDLPPVTAHAPWLETVFANLIDNAIKYMGTGNPGPQIVIRGRREGDVVRYEVQDNGIGIAEADQARLFAMFTRLRPDQAGGSGLGLAIVERVITRLNGQVGVVSTPGEGSTFWFTLPAPPR
ncbi:MAG: hypothetical protein Kow00124_31200 [Anaerolineae bacterium]